MHSSYGSCYSTQAGMTEGLVLGMEAKERMQEMLEHAEGDLAKQDEEGLTGGSKTPTSSNSWNW